MQPKDIRAPKNRSRKPHLSTCKTCGEAEVSTSLVAGECPECAGQLTFTLRGEGGRFLPNLGPRRPARRAGGERS